MTLAMHFALVGPHNLLQMLWSCMAMSGCRAMLCICGHSLPTSYHSAASGTDVCCAQAYASLVGGCAPFKGACSALGAAHLVVLT